MVLAARGSRNLDGGEEPVEDLEARALSVKAAGRIYRRAAAMALALTAIAMALSI